MQALREIHKITSNTLIISVPKAFQNRSVEMLPLDRMPLQRMVQSWRAKLARATKIRTKIAARRGKQPLTPAVDIINQTREERNEFFDNLR
jgi:hypothetical protein